MKRFFLTFALLLSITTVTRADQEAPLYGYTRLSADKRFIFVMKEPVGWRGSGAKGSSNAGAQDKVVADYPRSGLYRNNGSRQPLWTVDWYAHQVYVASDGRHLVREGPWPRTSDGGQTLALAFYRDGRQIRSYRIQDLIPDINRLPHTVSHFSWARAVWLDDRRGWLTVGTYYGRTPANNGSGERNPPLRYYIFDIKTGRIVRDFYMRARLASLRFPSYASNPIGHPRRVTGDFIATFPLPGEKSSDAKDP